MRTYNFDERRKNAAFWTVAAGVSWFISGLALGVIFARPIAANFAYYTTYLFGPAGLFH